MSSNTPGHNRVTEEKLGFTALDRAVFLVKIFTEKAHYHLKEEKKKVTWFILEKIGGAQVFQILFSSHLVVSHQN